MFWFTNWFGTLEVRLKALKWLEFKKRCLDCNSNSSFQVALNGLENILRLGEQEAKTTGGANPYAVIIEEVFGLDKIEFLQSHENIDIYKKAFDIIERYFGTEEEDKDVSVDLVARFLLI